MKAKIQASHKHDATVDHIGGAREEIIVFAREPEAGRVKTRLAGDSDARFALSVYRRLLARSLRLAHRVRRSRNVREAVCGLTVAADFSASPATAGSSLADTELGQFSAYAGATLWRQPSGDLGERMQAAFAASFARGAQRVILLGCDCPTLRHRDLHAALTALDERPVVLAPTADGGYCLIGLRAPAPQLFNDMRWSQPDVFATTVARAGAAQVCELTMQRDVDHLADWQHWCAAREAAGLPEARTWYPGQPCVDA